MDDVQLANYIAGTDPGPVITGAVTPEIARHLEVRLNQRILLSDYNLTKTKFRHPEVDFQDYVRIPEVLEDGFVVPGNRKRSVEIGHIDVSSPTFKLWSLSLKATYRNEVFVTMIRLAHLKDLRRVYRRAFKKNRLIRDHRNELARRLLRRASSS